MIIVNSSMTCYSDISSFAKIVLSNLSHITKDLLPSLKSTQLAKMKMAIFMFKRALYVRSLYAY